MHTTAEIYFRHWHLLKLRIIEVRRLCFSAESLFEFEAAIAQHRKILEGIAQSWVLIGKLGGKSYSRALQKSHNPHAIFNQLRKDTSYRFPEPSRLTIDHDDLAQDVSRVHILDIGSTGIETAKKTISSYERLHCFLHSMVPLEALPIPEDIEEILSQNFAGLAKENQEIWNAYAQHVVYTGSDWFFVNLGMNDTRAPSIVQLENNKQLERDVDFDFAVRGIAGWDDVPDWASLKQSLSVKRN